jgi:hypothetical protein
MSALAIANEVRLARYAVKRFVARGETTIGEALGDPCCQTMPVFDLLIEQRQWGRDRTVNVLGALAISEKRRIGELTDRQRSLLVRACEPRVAA